MNNATLLGFALFGHQDPPRFVFRSKHTSMGLISATGGGLFEPPTKGLRLKMLFSLRSANIEDHGSLTIALLPLRL
jgi:hypothetical protein